MPKTILITGASRGIGAAAATLASRQGANVVLFARPSEELKSVTNTILHSGANAISVEGDISNQPDCERVIEETLGAFGGLDGLVNNAGTIRPINTISKVSIEDWRRCWEVNFLGALMLIKEALPYIRQRRGRIVNVSSGAAQRTILGWGAYSTSKAALDHLTRFLAAEEKDVISLGLRPGVVDTAMQSTILREGKNGMPVEEYERSVRQKQEGRLISPNFPARTITALVLVAPIQWSGMILDWNDPKIETFVQSVFDDSLEN